MKTLVFEGTITALTSVSHIGESYGINSKLRREKVIQADGSVEQVPIISGNSLRGILRDRGMLHMLACLGYGVEKETGAVQGLSLAAFYFLFSGGALTKTGDRGINIGEARRWRELIPLVALFGGAMGNQIMSGKLHIGKAIPICQETAFVLPTRFVGDGLPSIWDLCQEEAYTRRDDEKNEGLRRLIAPEVRGLLEAKAIRKQEQAGTTEDVAGETGQTQQMRYYIETLAAGTQFFWDISLQDVTGLEFEAFCVTLAEFSRFPYIGGKSGVGHGKVAIEFDRWLEIDPRIIPSGTDVSMPLGNCYMDHLRDHADDIKSLFRELA